MSTKSNPGRFNCYAAAFPDETIFTMLARDPAFPATVRFWCSERIRLGKDQTEDDQDRIAAAYEEAKAAEAWREANLDPFGDGTPTWRVKMGFDDATSRPIRLDPTESYDRKVLQRFATLIANMRGRANRDVPVATGQHAFDLVALDQYADQLEALVSEITVEPEYNGTAQEVDSTVQDVPETADWSKDSIVADPANRTVRIEGPSAPVIDTAPSDLAHSPEVPPHRFASFFKGERYAYARGLEVNPTHLPVTLDEMARDGWELRSIFGATDSKHVGFIFERRPEVVVLPPAPSAMRRHLDAVKLAAPPAIPEGLDAEIEVHITATRQTHADDLRGWLYAQLSAAQPWPVNARIVGLIDGQSERAFDFQCGPSTTCTDRGNAFQP